MERGVIYAAVLFRCYSSGMKVGRKVGFGKKSKISPVFLLGFFEHCERITPSEDAKANLLSE